VHAVRITVVVVVVVEEVDVVVAQPVAVHASQQLANDPAHALPFPGALQ